MARCLLLEANLPKELWTYAVMTAVYIRNRCFNSRLGKTPYEALTTKQPNLGNMHAFGTTCYAYVQNAKKPDPRSVKGIFVGYDKESPAYLVYHPETNKISKVRCVKFIDRSENEISPNHDPEDEPLSNTKIITNDEVTNDVQLVESVCVAENEGNNRYPTRTRNKPQYFNECALGHDFHNDNANYTIDYLL